MQGLSADHGSGAGCRRNRQTGRLRHAGAERDPTEAGADALRCGGAAEAGGHVLRQLAKLAFGGAEDAVRLALARGETEPEGLELSAVSELRVTEKGVEVKLVDRVRALETLWQLWEQADGPAGGCAASGADGAGRRKREDWNGNDMIQFSRKQRQVLTWWRQNRWQAIICDGAVRSGKTFCMGLSFFPVGAELFSRAAVCLVRQDGGSAAAEFADGAGAAAAAHRYDRA